MRLPGYDLQPCSIGDVRHLFLKYHGYASVGSVSTYSFAVYESGDPIAAFVWQPPPPGASKSACPTTPQGVLSLSRMVAVPRSCRALNHISKPLRRQMRNLIDRGRWPVLITFHDEGMGHTGHVYKCSGWTPTTKALRPAYVDHNGSRVSVYSNGKKSARNLEKIGNTTIQRWEHRACKVGSESSWMFKHGWRRKPIPGKVWSSGNQAYKYVKQEARLAPKGVE